MIPSTNIGDQTTSTNEVSKGKGILTCCACQSLGFIADETLEWLSIISRSHRRLRPLEIVANRPLVNAHDVGDFFLGITLQVKGKATMQLLIGILDRIKIPAEITLTESRIRIIHLGLAGNYGCIPGSVGVLRSPFEGGVTKTFGAPLTICSLATQVSVHQCLRCEVDCVPHILGTFQV